MRVHDARSRSNSYGNSFLNGVAYAALQSEYGVAVKVIQLRN